MSRQVPQTLKRDSTHQNLEGGDLLEELTQLQPPALPCPTMMEAGKGSGGQRESLRMLWAQGIWGRREGEGCSLLEKQVGRALPRVPLPCTCQNANDFFNDPVSENKSEALRLSSESGTPSQLVPRSHAPLSPSQLPCLLALACSCTDDPASPVRSRRSLSPAAALTATHPPLPPCRATPFLGRTGSPGGSRDPAQGLEHSRSEAITWALVQHSCC